MARNSNKLSAYYGNLIVNIAKKNVQKIHPEIKRQICKKCRTMLVDGCSATTRVRRVGENMCITWMCKLCGTKKKLLTRKDRDNRVWLEKPEAVVEVIEYNRNNKL